MLMAPLQHQKTSQVRGTVLRHHRVPIILQVSRESDFLEVAVSHLVGRGGGLSEAPQTLPETTSGHIQVVLCVGPPDMGLEPAVGQI